MSFRVHHGAVIPRKKKYNPTSPNPTAAGQRGSPIMPAMMATQKAVRPTGTVIGCGRNPRGNNLITMAKAITKRAVPSDVQAA
jgi:hypothetical protein